MTSASAASLTARTERSGYLPPDKRACCGRCRRATSSPRPDGRRRQVCSILRIDVAAGGCCDAYEPPSGFPKGKPYARKTGLDETKRAALARARSALVEHFPGETVQLYVPLKRAPLSRPLGTGEKTA